MYAVYGTVASRTARVLWLLEELGLPYEHVAAGPQSAAVRALSPAGKVPVLLADGVTITDSTAILHFLADRHGRFTHPAGSLDRARQDSLTQFLLDEMDAALWTAARHSFILPADRRLAAIKDVVKWEFEQAQHRLLARIGSDGFAFGSTLTVPDFILAHCLIWAQAAKFPVADPRLVDYLARMRARPAFQRAMAR